MKIKAMFAALSLAALALFGVAALPAQAQTADQASTASVQSDSPVPKVTVHSDNGANGVKVAHAISQIRTENRGAFVEQAVDAAFEASGKRFNVMIMNLRFNYQERLQGIRLFANIQYDHVRFGLWIAESGQFINQGEGSWFNWGFKGWYDYDRNTGTVNFRRP